MARSHSCIPSQVSFVFSRGEGQADGLEADTEQGGPDIEVVQTFIPSDRWPEVQAALRGDTPIHPEQSEPLEDIQMIHIDDMPDEDGN